MKNPTLIVLLFVLSAKASICLCAQPPSEDEKSWLIRNIKRPEAKMMFIMTLEKAFLDLDNLPGDASLKKEPLPPENEADLKKQILAHKYEAGPYIRLYTMLRNKGRHDEGIKTLSKGLENLLERIERENGNLDLVNAAVEIYQVVNQLGNAKKLLTYYLESNPRDAEALIAIANLETVTMDPVAARNHIDQAYAIDPSLINIYVAEGLYAIYQGLIAFSNQTDSANPMPLSIPTRFLEKAEQEHPGLAAPLLVRHGLELFQIFYAAVFRHADDFKRLKPFRFSLGAEEKKRLEQSRAYFEKLCRENKKNDFYLKKCLVLAAVMEGDLKTARIVYEKTRLSPGVDNDLFRLMAIGEVMQVRFRDAIAHMEKSIQVRDNIDDRLFLASLYAEAGQPERSFQTLIRYAGEPDQNLLIGRLGYALMAGRITEAARLHERLKNIDAFSGQPAFKYFSGVVQLLQGERHSAVQVLKTLPEQDRFYESAFKIIKHFN